MRTIQSLLVSALAILAGSVNASAYDLQYGDYYFNLLTNTRTQDVGGVTTYYYNVEATSREGGYSSFEGLYTGKIEPPSTFTVNDVVNGNTVSYICTLTRIGDMAFANNYSATEIIIPATVTEIANMGFLANQDLRSVTCLAKNPPKHGSSYLLFHEEVTNNGTLYVPQGCVSAYKSASGWSAFSRIEEMTPSIGNHDYVDLGLPSRKLWSATNYGSTTATGYGTYVTWSSNDIVTSSWGEYWGTPTKSEMQELVNNCTFTWGSQNGVNGCTVTGPNGSSMFIPAGGYKMMGSSQSAGKYIYCWSSTESTDAGFVYVLKAGSSSDPSANGSYNSAIMDCPIRPIVRGLLAPENEPEVINVTGVSLDRNSLNLEVGESRTLTVSVQPSDATDKSVSWTTYNTNVATVSPDGLVTAVSAGETTIAVTTNDGSYSAYCTVTVKANEPFTPEYVDMGFPSGTKWATCNLGAEKPEGFGDYYAWGEKEPYYSSLDPLTWKEDKPAGYSWSNYFDNPSGDGYTFTKYTYGGKSKIDLEDDAANFRWGGTWHIPSVAEMDELGLNTTREETVLNGVRGLKFTSTVAGYEDRWIFLPLAGYMYGTEYCLAGEYGNYFTSELYSSSRAWYMDYPEGVQTWDRSNRNSGFSVRPVCTDANAINVTGVSLDRSTLMLYVGDISTLVATISPSNASNKSVSWTTSNYHVAEVRGDGQVTAIAPGEATITVTTSDGLYSASCALTVKARSDFMPEYVDLGLSVMWATCNVGATSPEEYGDYFAWGETTRNSQYSISTYKYCQGSETTMTKYCLDEGYGTVDNKSVLDLADDAANANWGGNWRMPTRAEFLELVDKCTFTKMEGGYLITSNVPGYTDRSIFLPYAGFWENGSLYYSGTYAVYWTSTLDENNSSRAYNFDTGFDALPKEYDVIGNRYRYDGRSVRPVMPKASETQEYVDLGLSVNWATCNVGASSPEEYGDYFAWGDTEPKRSYYWQYYFDNPSGDGLTFLKYNNNGGRTVLAPEDDAAHVNMGGNWRMPTKAEFLELVEKCTFTEEDGGYRITSNVPGFTGNSIFLPFAGFYNAAEYFYGNMALYWTSTIDENSSACAYNFDSGTDAYPKDYDVIANHSRYDRRSVRGVLPKGSSGDNPDQPDVPDVPDEPIDTVFMFLHMSDGTTIKYPVMNVDSVSFGTEPQYEWVTLSKDYLGSTTSGYDEYSVLSKKLYVKKFRYDTSMKPSSILWECVMFKSDDSDYVACYNPWTSFEYGYEGLESNSWYLVNSKPYTGTRISDTVYEIDFDEFATNVYLFAYQKNVLLEGMQVLVRKK